GVRLVSGGTDNHLMLCDLRPLTLTGRDAANLLEEAGIIVNKNCIPYDHQPPAIASGIRPGTPALTTRGMKEPEMRQIGVMMARVRRNPLDPDVRNQVRNEVLELCGRFPVYDDVDVV
ncbi:MAG: serine hydroxymethyltransferase, partial [Armatimonadetes bacterium]|nr:serine hydroxymethyltransferase [Armatimonadota bacterium]